MRSAADILENARVLVNENRHDQHGEKTQNHRNIANLWNAYIYNKHTSRGLSNMQCLLDEQDVAVMQALLKIARTLLGEHNEDDYIDGAGYLGIAGELANRRDLAETTGAVEARLPVPYVCELCHASEGELHRAGCANAEQTS